MFTGIITDIGVVARVERFAGRDMLAEIHAPGSSADIATGASIAHSGVCLTVVERGERQGGGCWWTVQASDETLSKTTLGGWRAGSRVNLERSLKLGDELGGHLVSGHVDAVGTIVSVRQENESWRVEIEAPPPLWRFIAAKGSIAVDGISLTVNSVEGGRFGLNIIPHTWSVTTLGDAEPGTRVNLEADMLARYVARMRDVEALQGQAG